MRNEALQKVTSILNDAKFITPQLGELPAALSARMTDSNTNLVQQALTIGQALAVGMGPSCKQHVRHLLPGFLQALSVNKVFSKTLFRSHLCIYLLLYPFTSVKAYRPRHSRCLFNHLDRTVQRDERIFRRRSYR